MSIAEKMSEIAANVPLVYKAGQDKGLSDFWEVFQDGGKRTYYNDAFYGGFWGKNIFVPKYDITPKGAASTSMFQFFNRNYEIFDLAQYLEDLGVTLDMSNTTTGYYTFYYMNVSHLPVLDMSNATTMNVCFRYNLATTIDKVIFKDDGSQTGNNVFNNMTNLQNIVIEGKIGLNIIDLSASTLLSKASITSFVNALLESASGKSITFSLTAVNNAFETSPGMADGSTSEEWGTLIATKSNWTISLA